MSEIRNFIIREHAGLRFANSLVLGAGLDIVDTAGGIPELTGSVFTGVKGWPAANYPLPHLTETAIPLASFGPDSGGFWNAAAPTRLTVPPGAGGVYMVVARGVFSAGTPGACIAGFRLNGGAIMGLARLENATSSFSVVATELVHLQDGDYLELRLYQETGATINAIGGPRYETSIMMSRVGV